MPTQATSHYIYCFFMVQTRNSEQAVQVFYGRQPQPQRPGSGLLALGEGGRSLGSSQDLEAEQDQWLQGDQCRHCGVGVVTSPIGFTLRDPEIANTVWHCEAFEEGPSAKS